MVRRRREASQWADLGSDVPTFLPDEDEQAALSASSELRDRLARLEAQMLSQYNAMAAYASLAQQHVDTARAESRHDLDRSQSTMIGLIERVRRECNDHVKGLETRMGGGPSGDGARIVALEQRTVAMEQVLEQVLETQRQLSATVADLFEEKMRREGWLVSGGSPDELSLR